MEPKLGVVTRSMTRKQEKEMEARLHQRIAECPFLYEDGVQLSLEGLRDKIFCIPDRKGREMYYTQNKETGLLQFLGYKKFINKCTSTEPHKRQLLIDKCLDRKSIQHFTDDVEKVREFLSYYESVGGIEPCILDFLEYLSLYTKMTFEDLTQILGGAFTVLKGDHGRVFRKFQHCQQEKFSIYLPKSIFEWDGTSFIPSFKPKWSRDFVPMSSHDNYMTNAFRMGAGQLVLCDKEGLYKTDNPRKNPRFDILVGLSKSKGFEGDTCFQFESCRMGDLKNFVRHGLVFFEYKWVRKNVGAFGYSTYTDAAPLVIDTCSHNVCPRFLRTR